MKKLPSLSIFFPTYNDAGTIASLVVEASVVACELTDNFEVIVINDGSSDQTLEILLALGKKYPFLKIIEHQKNMGYGKTLQDGFYNSGKEFIFYTDGDGQYDVTELKDLVGVLDKNTDVVQGYKILRADPLSRIILGDIYNLFVRIIFGLKVRDVDCDFRLFRKRVFKKIKLESSSGVICVELMKKIQDAGFNIKEVQVSHYFRQYGKSQFFNFKRLFEVGVDLTVLWFKLVLKPAFVKNNA